MKKKTSGKIAIAIAIAQHPAVQQALREIGDAAVRKTRDWWIARQARKKKAVKKSATALEKKSPKPTAKPRARKRTAKRAPAMKA